MSSRLFARRLAAATATVVAALAGVATVAATDNAAAASSGAYVNPLAGHPWGIYTGGSDGLYPAYEQSSGAVHRTLAQEALRSHVRWYTTYLTASEIGDKIRSEIAAEQNGNPDTLIWMATFAQWPHKEIGKNIPLTQADKDYYKRWVNNAAQAIGSARVALVVEPDLPVATTSVDPAAHLALVRYAVQRFASLPRATVYLDAGSADWLRMTNEMNMLKAAGIAYAHGFSLGDTHHTPLVHEIRYGRTVSMALAKAGFGLKHFIVDTSDNGHGYSWGDFWAAHPKGDYNDPPACTSMSQKNCVSLGVPPTTDVTNSRWGLPSSLTRALRLRCDAFAWLARPWLVDNGRFYNQQKALDIVQTDPFLN